MFHVQGIPYVIYWKHEFSSYAACHFRHALLSVVQRYLSFINFSEHVGKGSLDSLLDWL